MEGDVVAALLPGKLFHMLEEGGPHMAAAGVFVHADIVYIERGELAEAAASLALEGAESIAKHGTI